jgi:outer membrane protein assembly factor BamD (BamD/ComL family)
MVYGMVQKYGVLILMIVFFPLAMAFSGCSKSADKLYTEGKTLIAQKETMEKGLEKLMLFEKKYPKNKHAPEVVLLIATTHQNLSDYASAIGDFQRLTQTYPGTPEAYKGKFLLGYLYYENLKDKQKAIQVFSDFVHAYPDSELTVSARVLLENIDLPVEEWSTVKKIGLNKADTTLPQTSGMSK